MNQHSPILEVKNLSSSLDHKTILNSLSFSLSAGELVALVGSNGAGKSSLLRSLIGLQSAAGSVLWFGKEHKLWPRREFALNVSYLPQRLIAPPAATVTDLLQAAHYPESWSIQRLRTKNISTASSSMLAKLGCQGWEGRRLLELSAGELQRVYLVAAILLKPKVLLLDEPSTFLDPAEQRRILRLLLELVSTGVSVIAVTHDLNAVLRHYSRVLALKHANICYDGIAVKFFPEAAAATFDCSVRLVGSADDMSVVI